MLPLISRKKRMGTTAVPLLFVRLSIYHAFSDQGYKKAYKPRLMVYNSPSPRYALFWIITDALLLSVFNAHVKFADLFLDMLFLGC